MNPSEPLPKMFVPSPFLQSMFEYSGRARGPFVFLRKPQPSGCVLIELILCPSRQSPPQRNGAA